MPRTSLLLPDDLQDAARAAGLNVSEIARRAIEAELDRRTRHDELLAYLDDLDRELGPPTAAETADAAEWVDSIRRELSAHRRPTARDRSPARELRSIDDADLEGFKDWLIATRGVTRKVAGDYRSRLRRAIAVDVTTLRPNVQADIRTAIKAFNEYQRTMGAQVRS